MKNRSTFIFFLSCWLAIGSCTEKVTTVWIDDLQLESFSEGIRPVKAKTNYKSNPISIGDIPYERGFGSITTSVLSFSVNGNAKRFTAEVGADDEGRKDTPIKFFVIGDRKILFESGEMNVGDPAKKVDVNLSGIQRVGLLVTDNIGGVKNNVTYCDWANAQFTMIGDSLPHQIPNSGEKYILTPKTAETPRINSAKVFGAGPGNPFLYTISATGKRPMQFSTENLPQGLVLDSQTGIISGKVNKKGIYLSTLKAKNELGVAIKILKINIGDTIALTPPIGWNGWNSWANKIDREKVIASADAMVKTGLSNHGWTYINMDDSWQGVRGGKLTALQPNEKFPEIKEMVDYIHTLGLKAGIYSTPYISSYAAYVGGSSDFPNGGETHDSIKINRQPFMRIGKYRFETNDARQMAEWGFDYLKYDWRIDVNSTERMSAALKKSGRDIVFSISNNAPIEKAGDWARLTTMWRTGPDIRDSWNSLYYLAFTLDQWAEFAGPGHWNDPDMMILGNVSTGAEMHPTRLTPDEQYTHVSIFSLLAAPLLIGCPIEQLDDFTLNLLTNDEVIEINQDPLGKSARLMADENGVQIWVKPLEDGSYAVGLFYTGDFGKTPQSYFRWGDETATSFAFDFSKAGLNGKWKLRDVWRQSDPGEFDGSFQTEIRHHGVVMLRMYPVFMAGHSPFIFPQASTLLFKFPEREGMPALDLSWYDGFNNQPKLPEFYGEPVRAKDIPPPTSGNINTKMYPGKIIYGKELTFKGGSHSAPLVIIPEDKARDMAPKLPEVSVSPSNHYANFLKACKGEEKCRSSFEVAGPLCQVMALGVLAQRLNTKLVFDTNKKQITSSKAGNELLVGPPPRKGWEQYYKM